MNARVSNKARLHRVLLVLLVALVSACSYVPRTSPPAEGDPLAHAWGSIPLVDKEGRLEQEIVDRFVASLLQKREAHRTSGETGRIPYRALTLSGGGSRGAYGAGVLKGWSESGDRPRFDVVTGISTGALLATQAFLGPEFDEDLLVYKQVSNSDIFENLRLVKKLTGPSMLDTAPLRRMLSAIIDEAVLERVAEETRKGRRLFIGTTNLDANVFTVWDMGAIARSARADRLERYIDVIMASAAFPVLFPPVYLEAEGENGTFNEMHVDGGVREIAFFFDLDLMDHVREAMEQAGISESEFKQELYLIMNGPIAASSQPTYDPVSARLRSITSATIDALMWKVATGSIYRMWVLAMVHGADFHLSFIPPEFEFTSGSMNFDPEEQAALFDLGRQQSLDGTAWASQQAPGSTEELLELIVEPLRGFDREDPPEWLERNKP